MKQTNLAGWRPRCLSALMGMVLAWPLGLAAQADNYDKPPSWYLGLLGGYVAPDRVRDGEQGISLHGILGLVLDDSVSLELNGFGQEMQRETDRQKDYSYGVGLDLNLGTPAPGKPFFMIGGGMIHEELVTARRPGAAVTGYEDNSAYANAGLGYYMPFSFFGELWRLEGRYNVVFNDQALHPEQIAAGQTVPDEQLEDARFNFGFLLAFGRKPPPPPPPVVPPPPPPPPADADEDGVADELDQCPDTPRWVRADAAGCTPDSDNDGVDETRDCCPSTPAGTPVDGQGCVPPPPPPPAPSAPPPDADHDNDGVVDRLDQCPHTIDGYAVDANGCVKIQDVVIKSVHFELDSDALTPEAYRLLNSVAASFKAQRGVTAEVAGYADSTGNSGYNMALSQRRAAVVRDFLIYSGVPSEQLVAAGYGESRPIGDNKTEEGRAKNRRVEFRMLNK